MLVIGRLRDQDIVIELPDGRTVVVCVIENVGKKTRLGITADRDIPVHRGEVYQAILRERAKQPVIRDPLGVAEKYEEGAAS